MMGKGNDTQHNGALIATNQRVVFYRRGLFGEVLETIPYNVITSVEQKSFMGHRTLRLHTSHDDLEFKCLEKKAYSALVTAIDSGRKQSDVLPEVPPSRESPAEMIRMLAELRDTGVLSELEFETKKAKLLDQI